MNEEALHMLYRLTEALEELATSVTDWDSVDGEALFPVQEHGYRDLPTFLTLAAMAGVDVEAARSLLARIRFEQCSPFPDEPLPFPESVSAHA